MKQLHENIQVYLKQKTPDYWQGVKLYEKHPKARKNIIFNLNDEGKYRKDFMHKKLIAELEEIAGQKQTGRKAQLNASKASIEEPATIITQTDQEAPVNYEYEVAYENLPENLQQKVIQKGQYYDKLDALKKQMAELGPANNQKVIKQRKTLMTEMRNLSNSIKAIHHELKQYEKSGHQKTEKQEPDTKPEISNLTSEDRQLFKHLEAEEEIKRIEEFNAFVNYIPGMSNAVIVNELQRLRIKKNKQQKAVENGKKEATRKKNAQEIAITDKQIQYLYDNLKSREE